MGNLRTPVLVAESVEGMNSTQLADVILNKLRDTGDVGAANDLLEICKILLPDNRLSALLYNKEILTFTAKQLREQSNDVSILEKLFNLRKKSLLIDAPYTFDSYLQYIEYDKNPSREPGLFYLPRRHYLKAVVDAYQEIYDGNLDLLLVSLIKRGGKSQLGINFTNMISGRNPNGATLMEGVGDDLVKSFYLGCLEILQSPEYLHHDVFPGSQVVSTNADTKVINMQKKSRFATIMCRSIDSRQVGLSEASNLLYLDDCVEGRTEAKDRNRLDKKWEIISGDVLGRRIEGAPIVMSGTRYSIYDPMARMEEKAIELGWRYKAVTIPALDPVTDESNYEYTKVGKKQFTTAYLRNERKLLSEEQFESEFQQQPFEAKGLVLPVSKLNRYFKLPPDKEPDTVIACVDTAEKGADSTALVVGLLYGDDVYIQAVVFDNSPPDITKPQCVKALIDNNVVVATFESNNAGEYYARDVEEIMKQNGGRTSIRTKRTISNKHTRIELAADGIIKHFFFLDESLYERGSQYWNFMREATSYTRTGKSPHDDAIDSLSLLENEIRLLHSGGNSVSVFPRPF